MFQNEELKRLRKRKDLLVIQSNAYRLLLRMDCQQLRSPQVWMKDANNLIYRHPLWTAALAAAAGTTALRIIRKPRTILGSVRKFGKLASVAYAGWKLFRRKSSEL